MDANIISSLIIGGFGTGITLYYSLHTKKVADDQMMKDLFSDFNKRYWILNDSLYQIKDNYETLEKLTVAPNYSELKNKINDYFNLCAEEYFWYCRKRIDKSIWKSWHKGMNYWYNNVPVIKELWKEEIKDKEWMDTFYITNNNGFFIDK